MLIQQYIQAPHHANIMQLIHGNVGHAIKAYGEHFILFDGLRAVFTYGDFFIAPDFFSTITSYIRRFIIIHYIVLVFLRMNKDFFTVFFILKTQFIKTIAFMRLRLNRHPRFVFWKVIRRLCGAVISSTGNNRLVRVTF